MSDDVDRWDWQSLFASKYGPPDPSTRLVLFVILMHLFKDSASAFPSQKRIAEFTGLSTKSVQRHIEAATQKGWLRRRKNKRRGKIGIWYQYFPAIPSRVKKHLSRMDTVSRRKNSTTGHPVPTTRHGVPTTGQPVPVDWSPCPTNQALKQVLNQVPNLGEGPKNVVNDDILKRTGVEWAEATAAAADIGFRQPYQNESAKAYLTQVKLDRDKPPAANVSERLRRRVAPDGNGGLKLVTK